MSSKIVFSLNISANDYLTFYQGQVKYVITYAVDGRKVQFPAAWLRQFVTHGGVQGIFEISYDSNYKLQSMRRLD